MQEGLDCAAQGACCEGNAVNLRAAGYMAVYFENNREVPRRGHLFNAVVKGEVPFLGLDDLLLKLQSIGNALPLPENMVDRRFLTPQAQGKDYGYRYAHRGMVPVQQHALEDVLAFRPGTRPLVIELKFLQGGDMQGVLHCAQAGAQPVAFRNGMELLGLLAAAEELAAEQEIRSRICFAAE